MPYHQPTQQPNTKTQTTTQNPDPNTHNQEPTLKITTHEMAHTHFLKAALFSWQSQNQPPQIEAAMPYHQPTPPPNTQSQPTTHMREPNTHNHVPTLKSTTHEMAHTHFSKAALISWQNQNHLPQTEVAILDPQQTLPTNTQSQGHSQPPINASQTLTTTNPP
jgi:hypothetical protein